MEVWKKQKERLALFCANRLIQSIRPETASKTSFCSNSDFMYNADFCNSENKLVIIARLWALTQRSALKILFKS